MRPYPKKFYQSARIQHFIAGAVAAFLLFSFFVGVVGCDRAGNGLAANDPRGVDVEVDVRPAPCDSTMYTSESPVTERREVDPEGNVRVRVTVRTCCCCNAEPGPVRPIGLTGTGPGGGGGAVGPPSGPPAEEPGPVAPPVYSSLEPVPPGVPTYAVDVPPFVPTTITTAGGAPGGVSPTPWWISLVAAPLAFLSGDDGEPFPDGIICGNDSGLPTGPNRPRCN